MDEQEKTYVDFNPNDFVIRISPILDSEDNWTGELNVGYLTMDDNFLKEDDYQHIDVVTNMTLSAIPLMEEDLNFRNKLYKYTASVLQQEDKKEMPEVVTDDSNVIQLRFTAQT
jgi:hypothetical protein